MSKQRKEPPLVELSSPTMTLFDSIDLDFLLDGFDSCDDFGDLMGSDSQGSTDGSESVKRVRREELEANSNSQMIAKPRVLRTDIRRSYSTMFMNVMNSGELAMMYGFFHTFFRPHVDQQITRNHSKFPVTTLNISGSRELTQFWYSTNETFVDKTIRMKSCQLFTPLDGSGGGRIEAVYLINGTQIYDCEDVLAVPTLGEPVEMLEEASVVAKKRGRFSEEFQKRMDIAEMHRSIHGAICALPLRAEPLVIQAEGRITLYFDEDRRIRKLVVLGQERK